MGAPEVPHGAAGRAQRRSPLELSDHRRLGRGIEIANEVRKFGHSARRDRYRNARLVPSRNRTLTWAASSSLTFSRSRSVTSRRNREFSSWSSAIRSSVPRQWRVRLLAWWGASLPWRDSISAPCVTEIVWACLEGHL